MNSAISFQDFCKLESITFCMSRLRGNKRHNIIQENITSTQKNYLYRLWNFHYWLIGQEFHYDFLTSIDETIFQKHSKTIILDGLEPFLNLYELHHQNSRRCFTQLIKKYLHDPIHFDKSPQTLKIDYYAIKAYFDRNDCPLIFLHNFVEKQVNQTQLLTLGNLLHLLTVGQPTILQKAVFLCKFHRGLDTSTFVDRFNFNAWDQIIASFGTSDWNKWDLKKCPIPIRLIRIKTGVTHVGFLDVDAITSLREYLQYRQSHQKIFNPTPIFVNDKNNPITEAWIRTSFRSLAKKSRLVKSNEKTKNHGINPNSLRILLKSTLLACGVDRTVSEEAIGHKTSDRFQKHSKQNVQKMREEYSKASSTINIFSRLYGMINNIDSKL